MGTGSAAGRQGRRASHRGDDDEGDRQRDGRGHDDDGLAEEDAAVADGLLEPPVRHDGYAEGRREPQER